MNAIQIPTSEQDEYSYFKPTPANIYHGKNPKKNPPLAKHISAPNEGETPPMDSRNEIEPDKKSGDVFEFRLEG